MNQHTRPYPSFPQRLGLALAVLLLVTGCTKKRESTPNAADVFVNAGVHGVTERTYRIDPPDQIKLFSSNVPELNEQVGIVRPNGQVLFPLIGDVQVNGLTPDEAREQVLKQTSAYYVDPDLRLEVAAESKFFYVFGFGASTQGRFPYVGRVTVINALAQAGFNESGWPQQIRLSRPARDGNDNATAVIDFNKMIGYGDLSQNYLLEEGDIIEIPYSPLASWNEKVSRLLGPVSNTVRFGSDTARVVNTFD